MTTEIGKSLWQEGVHPLIDSTNAYLQTWAEWKDEWRKARLYEHYEMLIRRGWYMDTDDIHHEESVERIFFYLRMAEGHLTARTLEKPGDRHYERSNMRRSLWWNTARGTDRDWRQSLAHLAYRETVYSYLYDRRVRNHDESEASRYPWLKSMYDERVVEAFFNFFRVEGDVMPNFSFNVADEEKPTVKIVTDVLVNLCAARWHCGDYSSTYVGNERLREVLSRLLSRYTLNFLEILFVLKRLDVFERTGMYISGQTKLAGEFSKPEWSRVQFDDTELAKLRNLVLSEKTWTPDMEHRTEHDWYSSGSISKPDPRPPYSIHEALCNGYSQVARIYTLICDRQGVDWRDSRPR